MDPASIAGLVISVGSAVQTVLTYALDAKEATQDISNLLTELLAVKGFLEQLQLDQQQAAVAFQSLEFSNLLQSGLQVIADLERDLASPTTKTQAVLRQLKWPLKKDRVQKHIDMLERIKACCLMFIVRQTSSNDASIKSQVWDIRRLLEQDREERQARKSDKSRQEILRWLAPVNSDLAHAAVDQRHHAGTGGWLLRGPLMKLTEAPVDSSVALWLKGKSGSGKTVLMSQAIEELKRITKADETAAVAYFYCSFDNRQSHDPRNILGSFLAQLATKVPDLLTAYQSRLQSAREDSLQDLVALFSEILIEWSKSLSTVYLVIDGVNESTAATNIASLLFSLTPKCDTFRFLFSSTEYFDREPKSDYCHFIYAEMKMSAIDSDIKLYVKDQLAENPSLTRFTPSLKDNIARSVLELAHGNFRYARWQIDNIAAQPTGRDVQRLLRTLPHNLNESYSQLLNSTPSNSPERNYLRRALVWLCFAMRPLHLDELAEAVVLDEGDSCLDRDNKLSDPYILVRLSRGIIDYNSTTGAVSLAHLSIRTCLTSDWIQTSPIADFAISESSAHKVMLRGCLTYLLFDDFSIGYDVGRDMALLYTQNRYPLLPYAADYWTHHLQDPDTSDGALLLRFLATRREQNAGNYGSWLRRIFWTKIPLRTVQSSHPLYYAASLGRTSLVRAIIKFEPGVDLNAPGGMKGSSPIHVACFRGHKEIALILIKAGADCFLEDPGLGPGSSVAAWASTNSWSEILELIKDMHPGVEIERRLWF